MKKLLFLLGVAGLIFSSCTGSYTVAKRKYNKGFYVNVNHGNKTNAVATKNNTTSKTTSEKEEVLIEKVVAQSFAKSSENNNQVAFTNNEIVTVNNVKKEETTTNKKQASALLASAEKNVDLNSQSVKIKPIDINKNAKSAKKGDTNLILLVILCFLWWLNLIAVYIHDGKKITTNFWITLILNLTYIGGVIFALLVVLDVVDLS